MRKFFSTIYLVISAPFRLIIWFFKSIFKSIAGFFTEIKNILNYEVEDTPLPDVVSKVIEDPDTLLEQLGDLRRYLLRSVVSLALGTILAFTFNQQILAFLSQPLEGGLESLVAIEVTEPVGTVMKVSLLAGFAIAFPFISLQVWLYVAPAIINRRNRILGFLAIPVATAFFIGGMSFAFYFLLPTALPFLLNFMGINTIPRPSSYLNFVTGIMFWMGIAFEFPLIIFLLARLGIVRSEMLSNQWRLAVVIIAVLAALITPTVDPVNMSLVMGPLIILYAFSILLAKIAQKKRIPTSEA